MTKRAKLNIICSTTLGVTLGGVVALFYYAHERVTQSHERQNLHYDSYITELKSDPKTEFNSDSSKKETQISDLSRCWFSFSAYPDSIANAEIKEDPSLQIQYDGQPYQQNFTSHFVFGDDWQKYFLERNVLVSSAIILFAMWAFIGATLLTVINTKYKKQEDGKTI